METLIDLVTLHFQALLGIGAVVSVGWFVATGKNGRHGSSLIQLSQQVLLPALVFCTLAASPTLTWKRLLQQWPAVVVALTTHIASLVAGWVCTKAGSAAWMTEPLAFNNVSSFPILLIQILILLSSAESALGHLRWRSLDTVSNVGRRAVEYVVFNLLIVGLARAALVRFGALSFASNKGNEAVHQTSADDPMSDADDSPTSPAEDERSPLLTPQSRTHHSPKISNIFASQGSYILPLAAAFGLLVGLIKPIQRLIVGSNLAAGAPTSISGTFGGQGEEGAGDAGAAALTGLWKSFGLVLGLAGASFGVVDTLGQGAVLRMRADRGKSSTQQPPILGPILIIAFWRYIVIPAISISFVHGFRKINSTAAYLQDPVFSFVLALTTLSPPALPSSSSPHRARIHLYLSLLSLVLSIPLSILLGVSAAPGRGISWSTDFDLASALKRAAGGGLAGALAMVLQVLLLMPLRTVMNYQYRYGGAVRDGVRKLWEDGGWRRYYAGMGAALFQGPLARFGDTAANAFILSLLASLTWPVLIKTVAASLASAAFRMVLTPIDTLKTTQQTRGGEAGWRLLKERIQKEGVQCLWWGALATAAATFVGHYPWFGTYNFLSEHLPPAHTQLSSLARQAFIGFAASVASDTISNSLRVVKTYRQVHERDVGYFTAAKEIVHLEGIAALFGRGLPVRLLTNGLQGLLFSILWKRFEDGISNSGTAGWVIAISLVAALYLGALIRAVLSLGSVQAGIRKVLGRPERGPVRLEED